MNHPSQPAARALRVRRGLVAAAGTSAVLAFGALALPTPYVVYAPGPVLNTIGEHEGDPLLTVDGRASYPADGELNLTTIYTLGGGQDRLPFFRVVQAWADPAQDVYPEEAVYPRGATDEQISRRNTAQMDNSQHVAVAAALTELGIDYGTTLVVRGFATGENSDSLEEGDELVALNGEPIDSLDGLKERLNAAGEQPSTLTVLRDGRERRLEVATTQGPDGDRQLGVFLGTDYSFPFDVGFTLENVGGPSAGMMFSLGILDTLTPGDLTGGHRIAGTGTITPDGRVGPIGGIAQKLVASRDAGVDAFLAPRGNCDDVAGRVPEGLHVVAVDTLAEARSAVEAIAAGTDPAELPGCAA